MKGRANKLRAAQGERGSNSRSALGLACVLLVSAPATGLADGGRFLDLDIKALPAPDVQSLHMRPAAAAPTPVPADAVPATTGTAMAAASRSVVAATSVPPPGGTMSEPRDGGGESWTRALEEAMVFRFNIGYQLASSGTSGERGLSGLVPDDLTEANGDAFRATRQYALGDLTLGTDGWLVPSMSTYFASRMHFGVDGASSFTAFENPFDTRNARALLVRAAYAEIDGIGDKRGQLSRIYLRAGRQFRYGSTRFIANFDGLTAAYDAPGFEVSGFVGQRVALFVAGQRGLVAGGGFKLRGKELLGKPIDMAVDYLFLDGDNSGVGSARSYLEPLIRFGLGAGELSARARLADNGSIAGASSDQGFGLARLAFDYRQPLGKKWLLAANLAHLTSRELAYDIVAPATVDIVQVSSQLGLGLDSPGNATRAGARLNAQLSRSLELYGFWNGNFAHEQPGVGFNTSFQEFGTALYARVLGGLHLTGQYKFRAHQLDDDANQPGSSFSDLSGSGVSSMHEMSGEARYRARPLRTTLALSGYSRIYQLRSPYTDVTGDSRLGMRLSANARVSQRLRIDVSGEVAQPSPVLSPDLGTLTSVRALMEASF